MNKFKKTLFHIIFSSLLTSCYLNKPHSDKEVCVEQFGQIVLENLKFGGYYVSVNTIVLGDTIPLIIEADDLSHYLKNDTKEVNTTDFLAYINGNKYLDTNIDSLVVKKGVFAYDFNENDKHHLAESDMMNFFDSSKESLFLIQNKHINDNEWGHLVYKLLQSCFLVSTEDESGLLLIMPVHDYQEFKSRIDPINIK